MAALIHRHGPCFLLFSMYFLSFGIRFFHEGYYWDDFSIIWSNSDEVMLWHLKEARIVSAGFFKLIHSSFNDPVLVFKLCGIFFEVLSGVFFYLTLSHFSFLKKQTIYLLTGLFLVMPIFQSRDSLTLVQNSLSIVALWSGIYFYVFCMKDSVISLKKITLLTTGSILLFASYVVEATLLFSFVLYVLFAFMLYQKENIPLKNFKLSAIFFMATMLVKILFRFILFPVELYELGGVNIISLSPLILWSSITFSPHLILYPFRYIFSLELSVLTFTLLLVFGFLSYSFVRLADIGKSKEEFTKNETIFIIGMGVVLVLVGLIPPYLVGKVAYLHEWATRHTYLTSFGLVLLYWQGISLIKWPRWRVFAFSTMLTLCVFINFEHRVSFFKDWLKLEYLGMSLNQNPVLEESGNFIFIDQNERHNALKRIYRFYELANLLKKYGYDKENKLFVRKGEIGLLETSEDLIKEIELLFPEERLPFMIKGVGFGMKNLNIKTTFSHEIELITRHNPSFYQSLKWWLATGGRFDNVQKLYAELSHFYQTEMREI